MPPPSQSNRSRNIKTAKPYNENLSPPLLQVAAGAAAVTLQIKDRRRVRRERQRRGGSSQGPGSAASYETSFRRGEADGEAGDKWAGQ